MNAGPHYQKLYARVTHIWGNRKVQPDRSAMKGPHLERSASLITVPPASGKFFIFKANGQALSEECNACQTYRLIHLQQWFALKGGAPARQTSPGNRTPPLTNIETKKTNSYKHINMEKQCDNRTAENKKRTNI